MLEGSTYEEICRRFTWRIPERLNIAHIACDRHPPDRLAILNVRDSGEPERYSFGQLRALSCRLANALTGIGAGRGDRIALLMSQGPELATAHLAAYRIGAIAMPLFGLFGADAIEYRMQHAGASIVICDAVQCHKIAAVRDRLPALRHVIVVGLGSDGDGMLDYQRLLDRASDAHVLADTAADDPAFLIYTSGTTGHPKGTMHGHRSVMAHVPSVSFWLDFYPRGEELHWTPNDWAWLAGLGDVLLASLYFGQPVLAHRFAKFDPERALDLVRRHDVNVALIPPTALKMMRNAGAAGREPPASLRAVATGGESLGAEMLDWGRRFFGLTFSEGYGLTEFNFMTGNCARLFEPRPGSCGRAFPGRTIAVVDPDGNVLPPGQEGIIAARHPDPIMMLGYWRNPEATAQRSRQGWFLSGDVGHLDEDGYFWFKARDDDLITSGGYRIGPGEIEECLIGHPAVALAAAVGAPDPVRTEIVKAFIQLRPGFAPSDDLKNEIREHVKARLAAHEYPREIEFVDSFPTTVTGKILRRELKMRPRRP